MMRTRNPLILHQDENEIAKIRDYVVSWYEKNWKNREIESFCYDLSRPEDRLKIFVLGIFFNCILREDEALQIFKEMEVHGFISLSQLDRFEENVKRVISELEKRDGMSHRILKLQDIVDSVSVAERLFSQESDIVGIYRRMNGPEEFIRYLYDQLSDVKVKLFWLCREYRNLLQIPNEYCYVPDRHVTRFLWNVALISRENNFSLDDCLKISKAMSEHLGNRYFDLPFMRFHQKKCKNRKGCPCEISCRFNPRTDDNLDRFGLPR